MINSKIYIHHIDFQGSIADGPGVRIILYVQGCKRHCKGCHNPQTWDLRGGNVYNTGELAELIAIQSPTNRITISGGEPLLQTESVSDLIYFLKRRGFDIALYTGNELKDVPKKILEQINYIKVGAFIQEKKCTDMPYIGSWNQKFICLRQEREWDE